MRRRRPWAISLAFAIGTGTVLCAITLLVHFHLASFGDGDGLLGTGTWLWPGLWFSGGAFLFGALPACVSARYRLVTPFVVAVGVYGWALANSLPDMVDAAQWPTYITTTIFEMGLWLWPIPLWAPLVVGAFEYGLRRVVSVDRSDATS